MSDADVEIQDPLSPLDSSGPSDHEIDSEVLGVGNTNTHFGQLALSVNGMNKDCTAFGCEALKYCVTGEATGFGRGALRDLTSAEANCALGYCALHRSTEKGLSDDNTAVGHRAAFDTNANRNSAFGSSALVFNVDGEDNCAFGAFAMPLSVQGSGNAAYGSKALHGLLNGQGNTALGFSAQAAVTTISEVTAVGAEALRDNRASGNTSGGFQSMRNNQTGSQNTAWGLQALESNVSGGQCTALGYQTLRSSWGNGNTGVGAHIMSKRASTGEHNSAVGAYALHECTGSRNTAVGYKTLAKTQIGHHNTALGYAAMSKCINGTQNTFVGAMAGAHLENGLANTGIGYNSGPVTSDLVNTLCLGAGARATVSNELVMGSLSHKLLDTHQVGVAGGAMPLPATPDNYLCLTFNGTRYVLPLYRPQV